MSGGLSIDQYVTEASRSRDPLEWNLGGHVAHFSASSLTMGRRCPYQWQQRYLKGRRERPGEAPVTGTAVHAGLELNFGQKIQSGIDMPATELLEWYMDVGFGAVVEDEQDRSGVEIFWDSSPDQARTRGRAMLAAYHQTVAPRVQPISVEGKFSSDAFGLPVPLEGRYDVEQASSLIDFKTGKRKQSKPKESWRIQAAIYTETTDKPIEFHSISATSERNTVTVVTPLEAEALLVQPTRREREQMRRDMRAIVAELCLYMALYGPDDPWPTHGRTHDWACDYCGFRATCPAWED